MSMGTKVSEWLDSMRSWFTSELSNIGGAELEASLDGTTWVPITELHFKVQRTFRLQAGGQPVVSDTANVSPPSV